LLLIASCSPAPVAETGPDAEAVRLQQQAHEALATANAAEAVELLREATRVRPHDSQLWNDLGLAQEATGDWRAAISSYEAGIRASPRDWRPHLNLAVLCMRHGISGRAQTEFEEAVRAAPLNADIEWNFAVALMEVGQPEQARLHLLRALNHDPAHGEVYAELARAESRLGETDQALVYFARAGSLGVSNASYHANYGTELMRARQWLPSERQLRLATEMDSSHAVAWSHLGIVRLQRGRNTEAIAALRQAQRLDPGNEDYRFNLATALARNGDHAGVLAALQAPPPQRADLLALQGMSLRALGRTTEAVTLMRQAADKAPRDVDVLNNLGVVLAESGDVAAARDIWLRVLQISPANEAARSNLRARGGLPAGVDGDSRR
jgi:Flp pilus assembly protein TadD